MITLNVMAIRDTAFAIADGRPVTSDDVIDYIKYLKRYIKSFGFQVTTREDLREDQSLWTTSNSSEAKAMRYAYDFWDWMDIQNDPDF